jgi:serine O-acetyltransferase
VVAADPSISSKNSGIWFLALHGARAQDSRLYLLAVAGAFPGGEKLVNGGDYRFVGAEPITLLMGTTLARWVAAKVDPQGGLTDLAQKVEADFVRYKRSWRDLGLWVSATLHFGVWADGHRTSLARGVTSPVYAVASLLAELGTGCSIDRRTRIGRDLHLVHAAGVRIHPNAVIGERCGIMNDVTIGTAKDGRTAPRIGNDVFIGAGARILGPVTIGDGATVAANTLVITDVPARATVIGVPGRVLPGPRAAATGRTAPSDGAKPSPVAFPAPAEHLAPPDSAAR